VVRDLPHHAGAGLLLSRALVASGTIPEAATIAKALLVEYPNVAALHTQMGVVHMVQNDHTGARREFDRALELEPDSFAAASGDLAVDVAEKNVARARATIERRLQKAPTQPALLTLAAATYEALGDTAQQEAILRRLIEADPANIQAYAGLGMLYARAQRLDEARAEYEAVTLKSPTSVAAHTMIGVILQAQGKAAEAQKVYEKVLAINPRAGLAANNLAWLYAERGGNLDVALQLAQIAQQQLPEVPQVNDTLGWIYYQKDLAALAIPPLRASILKDPKNATYRYHLGLAYAKTGDKVKAKEAFDDALQRKPDFREASEARQALSTKG
jgi:tetratricopeptide (TPR) repeat protein